MKLHILPILTFLCVALVVSHAALPSEVYWKKVLPYTAMPKAIKTSLPKPEYMEDKGAMVNVAKGGVHVTTGGAKQGGGGTTVNVGPHNGVGVTTGKGHTNVHVGPKSGVGVTSGKPGGPHTNVNVGPKGGVGVSTGKPNGPHTNVGVGKGGVVVKSGPKKKPVYVGVKPGPNPFLYKYAASETQLHDDPTRALFFRERDMKLGSHMSLHFTQSTNGATFLPQEVANFLPFSSNKMSNIFQEFSIDPNSEEAKVMEETIKGCEAKGIQGEEKYCATSLESMVDYATSTLGKKVRVVSTETGEKNDKVENYIISGVTNIAKEGEAIVCHKQNYAYAVFYCHKTKDTLAYMVSLVGEDGSKAKALAVCHKDTSAWNPKHLAFQVLNVKPGSVPICHFLPEDHVVWVHN